MDLFVDKALTTLPPGFSSGISEGHVIQIVMNRSVVIPLLNVEEPNINDDLERQNDQREQEVKHKTLDPDSVQFGYYSFLVKHPKQRDENRRI